MSQRALDIKAIEAILPQRYPFLLIDKVLDYKENDYLIAVKNVTGNEWACAEGNELRSFPEALLIEAAAQAAIVLYHVSRVKDNEKPQYFLGKVEGEFLSPVQIGEQMKTSVSSGKILSTGGYSDISIEADNAKKGMIRIFYSIKN